jgi:signal transduction histidine kinase
MSDLPKAIEERIHHMLPRDLLHDLRTPLGHILGYSELMIEQMKSRGDEEFIPYLEKIRGAGHKLLELMVDNFEELRPGVNVQASASELQKVTENSET